MECSDERTCTSVTVGPYLLVAREHLVLFLITIGTWMADGCFVVERRFPRETTWVRDASASYSLVPQGFDTLHWILGDGSPHI